MAKLYNIIKKEIKLKETVKKIMNEDTSAIADIKLSIMEKLDIEYKLKEIDEAKEEKSEMVHKDEIMVGDTIMIDGKQRTVNKKDINKDELLGKTIFGDSFKSGKTKIERVLYKKYKDGKLVGWVAQP